jgi:hypothetical protein
MLQISEQAHTLGSADSKRNELFACALQREIFSEFFAGRLRKRCAVFIGMVINEVPLVRVNLAGQARVAPFC